MTRIALVDHATLTSCQRLLGDARVANLYNIDGDIAATEGLIQALLFCDEILCLDDYKEEFRAQRQERFDFITFLSKDDVDYAASMASARSAVDDISFRVRGREIDNKTFVEFFDQLKAHIVFNWCESSSTHYLTLNLLTDDSGIDIEKYSVMNAMLTTQLFGDSEGHSEPSTFQVKDKRGRNLAPRLGEGDLGITKQVQQFGAALNWLALKSTFYIEIAKSLNAELVLHPIRHAFVTQALRRSGDLGPSAYDSVTSLLRSGISQGVREITEASEPILAPMTLPTWCAYLATRTRDPLKFFDECKHIREEGYFVEARRTLSELEELNRERRGRFILEVNKLNASLHKTSSALLRRYGVESSQGVPISPILNVMTKSHTGLSAPSGIKIPMPRSFNGMTARYGFRGLLRSLTDDLVTTERLGALHEVITSRVKKTAETKFPIRAETSEWLGRDSGWKKWL